VKNILGLVVRYFSNTSNVIAHEIPVHEYLFSPVAVCFSQKVTADTQCPTAPGPSAGSVAGSCATSVEVCCGRKVALFTSLAAYIKYMVGRDA